MLQKVTDSIIYMLTHNSSKRNVADYVRKYIVPLSYEDTLIYSIGIGLSSLHFSIGDREHMAEYLERATRSISRFRRTGNNRSHNIHMNTWGTNLLPLAYPYEFPVVELPGHQDSQRITHSQSLPFKRYFDTYKLPRSNEAPLISAAPLIPGATILPGIVVPGAFPVPGIMVSRAPILSDNPATPCFVVIDKRASGTASSSAT